MAFRFQYGSFTHDVGTVGVGVSATSKYGPRGYRESIVKTMQIEGILLGDNPADLTQKMRAMEAAYSRDGRDAVLLDSNGNPTHHHFRNSDTLSGVRVVKPPTWVVGNQAEYVSYRHFSIAIEAEYPGDPRGALIQLDEQISVTGTGGPHVILIETLDTAPIAQQVAARTITRVTQAGSATGRDAWPAPPPPVLPSEEILPAHNVTRSRPLSIAGRPTQFRIRWSYAFQTARGAVNPTIPLG